jgi:hypothetical protein
MNHGPATSAGTTHHSVIADIIRKAQFTCVSPSQFPPCSPGGDLVVESAAMVHDPCVL